MRGHRFARFLKFVVFALAAAAMFGLVTVRLWNWLLPPLFGWHMIGFWQALGLLALGRILFGGFRGFRPGPGMYWRRRMMERWQKMTPEEREKFRQGMGSRCGHFGQPGARSQSLKRLKTNSPTTAPVVAPTRRAGSRSPPSITVGQLPPAG